MSIEDSSRDELILYFYSIGRQGPVIYKTIFAVI